MVSGEQDIGEELFLTLSVLQRAIVGLVGIAMVGFAAFSLTKDRDGLATSVFVIGGIVLDFVALAGVVPRTFSYGNARIEWARRSGIKQGVDTAVAEIAPSDLVRWASQHEPPTSQSDPEGSGYAAQRLTALREFIHAATEQIDQALAKTKSWRIQSENPETMLLVDTTSGKRVRVIFGWGANAPRAFSMLERDPGSDLLYIASSAPTAQFASHKVVPNKRYAIVPSSAEAITDALARFEEAEPAGWMGITTVGLKGGGWFYNTGPR
jgi:hypothetical protein